MLAKMLKHRSRTMDPFPSRFFREAGLNRVYFVYCFDPHWYEVLQGVYQRLRDEELIILVGGDDSLLIHQRDGQVSTYGFDLKQCDLSQTTTSSRFIRDLGASLLVENEAARAAWLETWDEHLTEDTKISGHGIPAKIFRAKAWDPSLGNYRKLKLLIPLGAMATGHSWTSLGNTLYNLAGIITMLGMGADFTAREGPDSFQQMSREIGMTYEVASEMKFAGRVGVMLKHAVRVEPTLSVSIHPAVLAKLGTAPSWLVTWRGHNNRLLESLWWASMARGWVQVWSQSEPVAGQFWHEGAAIFDTLKEEWALQHSSMQPDYRRGDAQKARRRLDLLVLKATEMLPWHLQQHQEAFALPSPIRIQDWSFLEPPAAAMEWRKRVGTPSYEPVIPECVVEWLGQYAQSFYGAL
jgi:hypothetical protein